MIELDWCPVGRAEVAAAALAHIVVLWYVSDRPIAGVAALAIRRTHVIELHQGKTAGVVAQIACTPHLPIVWILVAGLALGRCPLVCPLVVAALAVRSSVSAFQEERMLLHRIGGERDGPWCDRSARRGQELCQRLCRLGRWRGRCPSRPRGPGHSDQAQSDDRQ